MNKKNRAALRGLIKKLGCVIIKILSAALFYTFLSHYQRHTIVIKPPLYIFCVYLTVWNIAVTSIGLLFLFIDFSGFRTSGSHVPIVRNYKQENDCITGSI